MHAAPGSTIDSSVNLGKLRLAYPTMMASGTCGYGPEYSPYLDLGRVGALVTKSVTLHPREGNPPRRLVETCGGALNAIGLANVGLDRFLAEKVPALRGLGPAVLVNVAGHSLEDYVAVCARLDDVEEIAGVELNVSCPNVKDGLLFGTDADLLERLVAAVRPKVRRGVLVVKLSPNVTDIRVTARAALNAGADALSMVNTFLGMAIDADTWRPVLANVSGGLSGPAIKPMALHLVHRVWQDVAGPAGVPIVGMGGIQDWRDAVEFMLAGASAVAIGTALYADPTTPIKVVDGLAAYLASRGLSRVADLVGRLRTGPHDASDASCAASG